MELVACMGVKRKAPITVRGRIGPLLQSEWLSFNLIYSWASASDFILLKKEWKSHDGQVDDGFRSG